MVMRMVASTSIASPNKLSQPWRQKGATRRSFTGQANPLQTLTCDGDEGGGQHQQLHPGPTKPSEHQHSMQGSLDVDWLSPTGAEDPVHSLTRDGDEDGGQHQQRQLHPRAHQGTQRRQLRGRPEHVPVHQLPSALLADVPLQRLYVVILPLQSFP